MGSPQENYSTPFKRSDHHHSQTKLNLKILFLVVLTNFLTLYIFTSGSGFHLSRYIPIPIPNLSLPHSHYNNLLDELNSTRNDLQNTRSQISDLYQNLQSSNLLSQSPLLTNLSMINQQNYHVLFSDLSNEAKLAMGPHRLPLGFSPRMGTDRVYPSIGGACFKYKDELAQYMSYDVGGECPVDDVFAQKLMLKGCEPLPRRRCHPKSPPDYVEPTPLPESLWSIPPDTSIIWEPYSCKSYDCLVKRRNLPGFYDCKDCFDLEGREKKRWILGNFGIDRVLAIKPPGTIRIGLDIGGGTGTFAARMKERDVTIITTSMNLDGPFNSFIASRGLIPIHVSVSQRLPFFENTLDIVHSMHVLSHWIPETMLEFAFYDIYRVLRPGGIFWLDHFFCLGSQLNQTYVPMLNRVGFKKLRWNEEVVAEEFMTKWEKKK
ncbi:hypothetical protein M9H77_27025 [Catharanthus roseus]|uniref:Uncharacterized protein n=1 Tax=Catharanthus roseus TaxID=4058 RepID=A0ACC0AE18_CATRO|nr:hypothetical protein M9H77_27025 [Catharanthus roseus]